mgnify:CR=1 FL=1
MKLPSKQQILEIAQMQVTQRLAILAVCALFLWALVLGDQGLYQLKKLSNIKAQLEEKKLMLTEFNTDLRLQKNLLSKPENLEMAIRRELGYIYPGEVMYRAESTQK